MRTPSILLFSLLFACSSSVRIQDAAVNDDAAPSDDATATDISEMDANFGECLVPTDCVLVPASCCGSCGQPSRNDIDSVPLAGVDAQREMACSGPIACPECESPPDPTLLPDCSMAACTVLDLAPTDGPPPSLTACITNSDCVIRAAACCECGPALNEQNVVALNVEVRSGYAPFVCPQESICPPCEPEYPENLIASCEGDGPRARCIVIDTDR